jgi:hypothetical protein
MRERESKQEFQDISFFIFRKLRFLDKEVYTKRYNGENAQRI